MVLPIGFFAPLPLAIMIPFMAAQSFAMGHAFGTSFQYGKRKISSLTNEQFNALSATDLHGQLQADIRAMIPSMNQSFNTMEKFQIDIIQSMLDTIRLGIQEFGNFITGGAFQTNTTSTETSTSAIGEAGIFQIQGGSRTDIVDNLLVCSLLGLLVHPLYTGTCPTSCWTTMCLFITLIWRSMIF